MKRTINKINDDLIEICEYADPNVCFRTTKKFSLTSGIEPDNYDFVVFKEVFNPFDLFNDNKVKDKKLKLYKSIIKEVREYIENKIGKNNLNEHYREECKIAYKHILEILDKVEEGK